MPVLENVRPRQRDVHPSKRGQPIIIEPFNPAWQSNATVGSRERVEKHPEIQYTWKRGTEGGLSERDIIVQPILGSRGDFNKQPIAKVIDPDNIHLRDRNSVKKRYKSKTACEGALRRNNWVIYVQTAIQWVSTNEKIKYPQAISDIILQGMYFAQIQTDDGLKDAPINPEVYLMLYKGGTRNEVLPLVERSVERNENYFTTDRTTVLNAYRRFCDAEGRDATNGLSPWERYGDHSHDLDEFIQNRQNMINNNPINPSQRLIDILREPVMPGARNIVGTPVPMTPVRATTPIVPSTPQSNGSNGGFDTGGGFNTPVPQRSKTIGQTPDSGTPNKPRNTPSSTTSTGSPVEITTKTQRLKRNLYTSSSDDPHAQFHNRLTTLPTIPLDFSIIYDYTSGQDNSIRKSFLPPDESLYLPTLDNMRESFNQIANSEISSDDLEILCGCLIVYLFRIGHIHPDKIPLFITMRSLQKTVDNYDDDGMKECLKKKTIYILTSNLKRSSAVLTKITNLPAAFDADNSSLIQIKHFVMVTELTNDPDEALVYEANELIAEIFAYFPMNTKDDSKATKTQLVEVTETFFPLVFVMMFYQLLENSKRMSFDESERDVFLNNMVEIVLNASDTDMEKMQEILPPLSNTRFLLEKYGFRRRSTTPIPITPIPASVSPAARNLFPSAPSPVPIPPPAPLAATSPIVPSPQNTAIRQKPLGKVANISPLARINKRKPPTKKSTTVVNVPVPGVESEPAQRKTKAKKVAAPPPVRAEGKRQSKQRESYSPSPFKKQRKK